MTNLCSTLHTLNACLLTESESELDDVFKFKQISPIPSDFHRRYESSSSDGRSSTDRMFIPRSNGRFRSSSCDDRRHPGKPEYIHCRCCGKLKKAKVSFSDDVGDEDESDKCGSWISPDDKSCEYLQPRSGSGDSCTRTMQYRSGSCEPSTKTMQSRSGSCDPSTRNTNISVYTDSDASSRTESPCSAFPNYEERVNNRQTRGRHRERLHGRPPPVPHLSSSQRQRRQTNERNPSYSEPPSDATSNSRGSHLRIPSSFKRQERRVTSKFKEKSETPSCQQNVVKTPDNHPEIDSDTPIELIPSYIPDDLHRTIRSQSLDRNYRPLMLSSSRSSESRKGWQVSDNPNNGEWWSSDSEHCLPRSPDNSTIESSDISNGNCPLRSDWSSKADYSIRNVNNRPETAVRNTCPEKDSVLPVKSETAVSKSITPQQQTSNYILEGSPPCLPHRSLSVQSDQSDMSINTPSCEEVESKSPKYLPNRPPRPPAKTPASCVSNPQSKINTDKYKRYPETPPRSFSRTPEKHFEACRTITHNNLKDLPLKHPTACSPPNDIPPARPPKTYKSHPSGSSKNPHNKITQNQLNEVTPPLPPRGRPPRHPTDRPPDRPPKSWLQRQSTCVLTKDIRVDPSNSQNAQEPVRRDNADPPPLPPRARRSQSVDSVFSRKEMPGVLDPRRTASEGDDQKLIVEILV